MVNRRIVLDNKESSIYDIRMDQIKAIADAFAAVNPEKDGWFTGTIKFKAEGGNVVQLCDTQISRSVIPMAEMREDGFIGLKWVPEPSDTTG